MISQRRPRLVVPPAAPGAAPVPGGHAGALPRRPGAGPVPRHGQAAGRLHPLRLHVRAQDDRLGAAATLAWVDALLENYLGHEQGGWPGSTPSPRSSPPSSASAPAPRRSARTASSLPTPRARRRPCWSWPTPRRRSGGAGAAPPTPGFWNCSGAPATASGLLTNGRQFRLVYAGLDFESWCEWEADRWFDDGDGQRGTGRPAATALAGQPEADQGRRVGPARRRGGVPQAAGRPVQRAAGERPPGRRTSAGGSLLGQPHRPRTCSPRWSAAGVRPPADRRRGPRSVAPGDRAGGDAAGRLPVRRVPATAAGQRPRSTPRPTASGRSTKCWKRPSATRAAPTG